MSSSRHRGIIVVLVTFTLAGCRACHDPQEMKDCAATETVFHGAPWSTCARAVGDAGTITEAAAKTIRDEAEWLDAEANKLRALSLGTPRLVRKRDQFVLWHTEEARLCRELLQAPAEQRRRVEDQLTKVASDRRGWVDGPDQDCMTLLHGGHL